MAAEPDLIYLDASIFGAIDNPVYGKHSKQLLGLVSQGRAALAISSLLENEMLESSSTASALFEALRAQATLIAPSPQATQAQREYIELGLAPAAAPQVAAQLGLAFAGGCAMYVTWDVKLQLDYHRMLAEHAVDLPRCLRMGVVSPWEALTHVLDEDISDCVRMKHRAQELLAKEKKRIRP